MNYIHLMGELHSMLIVISIKQISKKGMEKGFVGEVEVSRTRQQVRNGRRLSHRQPFTLS